MNTNWKQIIEQAPDRDMGALLSRLARQAVTTHLSEQAKRGGTFDDTKPHLNRIKNISSNMEVNL